MRLICRYEEPQECHNLRAKADEWAARVEPALRLALAELPGATRARVAQELEVRRVPTARGGRWTSGAAGRLLRRLAVAG